MDISGRDTETTTDIQENAAVLQDKFSLPAGVTIQ